MVKPEAVFIHIGTYPSETGARAGYGVVKDLHAAGAVATYDAAVATKDDASRRTARAFLGSVQQPGLSPLDELLAKDYVNHATIPDTVAGGVRA
jgi:hypothetical protein